MQLDTLRQFRADLPPFWSFVPPRLIAILCPGFDFPPIMTCAAVPVGGASPPKMKSRRRTSSSTAAGHTTDHDLSIQEAALRATGCDTIRAEKLSGTTTQGREALQTVLDFLRPGDVPMVTCH
jgi:Resolvase, N terminal domain